MPATVRHVWVRSPVHPPAPDPGLVIFDRTDGSGTRWFECAIRISRPGKSPAVITRWMHERDVVAMKSRPESPDPHRWHRRWVDEQTAGRS